MCMKIISEYKHIYITYISMHLLRERETDRQTDWWRKRESKREEDLSTDSLEDYLCETFTLFIYFIVEILWYFYTFLCIEYCILLI